VVTWQVYILQCSDSTLYTGVTTDVERRVIEHNTNKKKGAKYTWPRRPVTLVWTDGPFDKSEAYRLERKIKGLQRKEKLEIIEEKKCFSENKSARSDSELYDTN